jgi:DNA-binding FrmR family transcriptional regulator
MQANKEKTLINFKKAQSHLAKIIEMTENSVYCIDIMQQNLAVIGLLKSAHQMLMEGHLNSCFKDAMATKNEKRKAEMTKEILAVTKMFNLIQEVGTTLFLNYPDYDKYKENLKRKKWTDNVLKDINPNPRESFKKLYGVYEVSEEDYNSSPSSVDSTDEKLIHDFGVLPGIEKDVDMSGMFKSNKN